MGIVDSKTFKSGDSVAVQLPQEIAFAADIDVTIERRGDVITIRPANDTAEALAHNRRLVAMLRAIGPADEVEKYDSTLTGPERPGLI
jgi:virulence-associated protein VagC